MNSKSKKKSKIKLTKKIAATPVLDFDTVMMVINMLNLRFMNTYSTEVTLTSCDGFKIAIKWPDEGCVSFDDLEELSMAFNTKYINLSDKIERTEGYCETCSYTYDEQIIYIDKCYSLNEQNTSN